MFGKLKIGFRIRAGFGIVLVLLAAIAAIAIVDATAEKTTFTENMALDRLGDKSNDINVIFGRLRRQSALYTSSSAGDDDAAAEIAKRKPELAKMLPEIIAATDDAQIKANFTKAAEDVGKYFDGFDKFKGLVAKQNDLTADLVKFGPKMHANVMDIVKVSVANGEMHNAALAGIANDSLMLARQAVSSYVGTHTPANIDVVRTNLPQFEKDIDAVAAGLTDAKLKAEAVEARALAPQYLAAFNDVVAADDTKAAVRKNELSAPADEASGLFDKAGDMLNDKTGHLVDATFSSI